ncbi:uncharacterized protein [Lolium perenne]|uniref:uncharacterized protein isoform X2 n=1 Tax=Lolium perenne TaxID=4522 RepID=UPI0021F56FD2|nr:uncharacterized protein LOC127311857 isoform X2 [Lolium perenne]
MDWGLKFLDSGGDVVSGRASASTHHWAPDERTRPPRAPLARATRYRLRRFQRASRTIILPPRLLHLVPVVHTIRHQLLASGELRITSSTQLLLGGIIRQAALVFSFCCFRWYESCVWRWLFLCFPLVLFGTAPFLPIWMRIYSTCLGVGRSAGGGWLWRNTKCPLGVFSVGFNNFNGRFSFGHCCTFKADSGKRDAAEDRKMHYNGRYWRLPSPPKASGTQWQWRLSSYQ